MVRFVTIEVIKMRIKAVFAKKIWTGASEFVEDGMILIEDGKISYVGPRKSLGSDVGIIDAKDSFVTPGFIDAHSHIGLIPEGLDWEYSDVNDYTGPITPQMRAIDAIHFHDIAFKNAISGGVTTVYTGPGSANVVGGIGLITKTSGEIIREEAALKMALGPKRDRGVKSKEPYPTTRMGTVALLRNLFINVKKWMNRELEIDDEKKYQYEIVAKVLKGEMPAKIHLSTSPDEIRAVLALIKEFNINASIDHVFGGDLLAGEIAEAGIPVVYGPPMIAKLYSAFKYVNDKIPVVLANRGVLVAIMTDHPVIPQKHLRFLASVVVRNGLDYNEALKMITINPAKILEIDERVGTLEVGKDADIVISSDHPLKVTSVIERVLINGEIVFEH
ncbi:MAG TPA: amidohydrolase [Thermotogaceae bacterium]|nr:amidohydrolase [Thermotogaceae bacterium]